MQLSIALVLVPHPNDLIAVPLDARQHHSLALIHQLALLCVCWGIRAGKSQNAGRIALFEAAIVDAEPQKLRVASQQLGWRVAPVLTGISIS